MSTLTDDNKHMNEREILDRKISFEYKKFHFFLLFSYTYLSCFLEIYCIWKFQVSKTCSHVVEDDIQFRDVKNFMAFHKWNKPRKGFKFKLRIFETLMASGLIVLKRFPGNVQGDEHAEIKTWEIFHSLPPDGFFIQMH